MPTEDIVVVASISERKGLFDRLENQLKQAQITFYVNQYAPDTCWDYISGAKVWLETIEALVDKLKNYKRICFCDAWDVIFYGTKQELIKKIPLDHVVFSMEKNCFPDFELASFFPDPKTPWRFINGGGYAGSPQAFSNWITFMRKHPGYSPSILSQRYLNYLLVSRNNSFKCDYKTDIWYCMFLDEGELTKKNGRPYNSLTGKFPSFIHFNADSSKREGLSWIKEEEERLR